jgi:hypothetical protein
MTAFKMHIPKSTIFKINKFLSYCNIQSSNWKASRSLTWRFNRLDRHQNLYDFTGHSILRIIIQTAITLLCSWMDVFKKFSPTTQVRHQISQKHGWVCCSDPIWSIKTNQSTLGVPSVHGWICCSIPIQIIKLSLI